MLRKWRIAVTAAVALLFTLVQIAACAATVAPKGQLSITLDDGDRESLVKATEILGSQGFRGVAYVPTGFVNTAGYVTWLDLSYLQDVLGWEIGNHSVSHPLMTTLTMGQIDQEFALSQQAFAAHGILVRNMATPYGDYGLEVLKASARYFRSHRPFHDQQAENVWPYNNHLLYVKQVQGGVPLAQLKSIADAAKANKTWPILVFHVIKDVPNPDPQAYEYGSADLKAFVDYVAAIGLPVVTIDEGLAAEAPNLLTNSSFDAGITQGWTTDNPQNIRLDTTDRGCLPTPTTSIRLQGVAGKNVHLFSPRVPVAFGTQYNIKCFLATDKVKTDKEIAFYIDEYNTSGQWISGQYLGGVSEPFVEEISYAYTPSSSNVRTASYQIIVEGGLDTLGFIDNVRWIELP